MPLLVLWRPTHLSAFGISLLYPETKPCIVTGQRRKNHDLRFAFWLPPKFYHLYIRFPLFVDCYAQLSFQWRGGCRRQGVSRLLLKPGNGFMPFSNFFMP